MRKLISVLLVCGLLLTAVFAQETENDFEFGFEGARFFNSIIPGGLDLSITYYGIKLNDFDTKIYLKLGGGYENQSIYRDITNGTYNVIPSTSSDDFTKFMSASGQGELAFIQGFSEREDGDNALEAFLFYRARYDKYMKESSVESLAWMDEINGFRSSFMAGLSYDTVVKNRHCQKSGIYTEILGEYAPKALNPEPDTDWWRVSAQIRGFLPVFDIAPDNDDGNVFNAYVCGFGGIDYIDGARVPMYVMQTFGGRDRRDGLGNSVRGYGWNTYDAKLKAVVNLEARLVGPKIFLDSVVPYLYAFADGGFYRDMSYGIVTDAEVKNASGFLASIGGGVALDLLGIAQAGVNCGIRLINSEYYNYEFEDFFWGIKFFLHF